MHKNLKYFHPTSPFCPLFFGRYSDNVRMILLSSFLIQFPEFLLRSEHFSSPFSASSSDSLVYWSSAFNVQTFFLRCCLLLYMKKCMNENVHITCSIVIRYSAVCFGANTRRSWEEISSKKQLSSFFYLSKQEITTIKLKAEGLRRLRRETRAY